MGKGLVLGSLILNEMEWLPLLYAQHKDWPELERWVFVEAADMTYAKANPSLVSSDGLSVDGTSEYLAEMAKKDERIVYIPHGFTEHKDPAQAKIRARQRYLDVANDVQPEFVFALDADEFYTKYDQQRLLDIMRQFSNYHAVSFRIRHPWRPPCYADQALFQWQVTGGFWDMAHCHWWRWQRGMCYGSSHNSPDLNGRSLNSKAVYLLDKVGYPECIHMAFSSNRETRRAKHRYYATRGEGIDPKRSWYVSSRKAWETWMPGSPLPRGAKVSPYFGPIPECFIVSTPVLPYYGPKPS